MQGHLQSVSLAVILLAGLTAALTLEETAKFYVKAGETFKMEELPIDGTTYYLLKINGEPAVALVTSPEGVIAVTDDARLTDVIKTYTKKVFDERNWDKRLSALNDSRTLVQKNVTDCLIGAETFLKSITGRTVRLGNSYVGLYFLISRSRNDTYKSEYDAIESLNKSFAPFKKAYNEFLEKSPAFEQAVREKQAVQVFASFGAIRSGSATLKNEYTTITSAYAVMAKSKDFNAILTYTFYDAGEKHGCSLNKAVTDSLTALETEFSDQSLKSVEEVKATVLSKTQERQRGASTQAAHAVRQEKLYSLVNSITNTTKLYEGTKQSISFTDLNKKRADIEKILENIKTEANSTNSSNEFDALAKKIEDDLRKYRELAAGFKVASAALAEAEVNVSNAVKRYGESDNRIANLKKQLDVVKKDMSQNVLSLQGATFPKVQFTNVTAQAKSLAETAAAIKPKESEIDPIIIGAVGVLLLGLAGTVYYFKKMKGESAASPPVEEKK